MERKWVSNWGLITLRVLGGMGWDGMLGGFSCFYNK